ncbi:MAG: P-loop NTPase fold protein [Candidatus Odinarchaeota archaeon]
MTKGFRIELSSIINKMLKRTQKEAEADKRELVFTYLTEKPIKSDNTDELQFGHHGIVSSLRKMINNSPESFTIGLFGGWGTGKSTIAESLKIPLQKDNIPLVIFDVWKHEGDALRRAFLKNLKKSLEKINREKNILKQDIQLEPRIDSKYKESSEKSKIDWKKVRNDATITLIFSTPIILLIILLLLVDHYVDIMDWKKVLPFLSGFLTLISGAGLLGFLFDRYRKSVHFSIEKEPFKDPVEFESSFKHILESLNCGKICIVFDNLDRVPGNKSIEIISTIKTFLEPIDEECESDVVFLIPCDVVAIKEHLEKVFRSSDYRHSYNIGSNDQAIHDYSDEYLRKFFNAIIWIPDFYSTELENYARQKLRDTKISEFDNDDLAAIITQVFSNNPRQIIQFINILISNYILLKEREIEGELEVGFSDENVPQLAKYLLVAQRYPDFLQKYKNKSIRSFKDTEIDEVLLGEKDIDVSRTEELRELLLTTEYIQIESLETFYTFRITDQEKKFPNINKLIKLLDSNILEEILSDSEKEQTEGQKEDLEYIKKLDLANSINSLGDILKERVRNTQNSTLLGNLLNSIFSLTRFFKLRLPKTTYEEISNKIKAEKCNISLISPMALNTELIEKHGIGKSSKTFNTIIQRWTEYLDKVVNDNSQLNLKTGFIDSVISQLESLHNKLTVNQKKSIQSKLLNLYKSEYNVFALFQKEDHIKSFLDENLVDTILQDIDFSDFRQVEYTGRANLILGLNKQYFNNKISLSAIKLISKVLNVSDVQKEFQDLEEIKKYISKITPFTTSLIEKARFDESISEANPNDIQNLLKNLQHYFTANNYGYSEQFLKPIWILSKNSHPNVKNTPLSLLKAYISNVPLDKLSKDILVLENIESFITDSNLIPHFNARAGKEFQLIIDLREHVQDDTAYHWISIWFPRNNKSITSFVSLIKHLIKVLPHRTKLIDEVSNDLRAVTDINLKSEIFRLLNFINENKFEVPVDKIESSIEEILVGVDYSYYETAIALLKEKNNCIENRKNNLINRSLNEVFLNNLTAYHTHICNLLHHSPTLYILEKRRFDKSIKSRINNGTLLNHIVSRRDTKLLNIILDHSYALTKNKLIDNILKFIHQQISSRAQPAANFLQIISVIQEKINKSNISKHRNLIELIVLQMLQVNRIPEVQIFACELVNKVLKPYQQSLSRGIFGNLKTLESQTPHANVRKAIRSAKYGGKSRRK